MMSKSAFARSRESAESRPYAKRRTSGPYYLIMLDSSGTKIDSAIDNRNSTISGFHMLLTCPPSCVSCPPRSCPLKSGHGLLSSREPKQRAARAGITLTTPVIVRHRGKATTRYNGSQSKRVFHLSFNFKDVVKTITQPGKIDIDQPR
jgi:hypothetical protein